jgi:hypothetical protein
VCRMIYLSNHSNIIKIESKKLKASEKSIKMCFYFYIFDPKVMRAQFIPRDPSPHAEHNFAEATEPLRGSPHLPHNPFFGAQFLHKLGSNLASSLLAQQKHPFPIVLAQDTHNLGAVPAVRTILLHRA